MAIAAVFKLSFPSFSLFLSQLTLTLEGFELMLETEGTDLAPGVPVLSLNAKAVVQVFDWNYQVVNAFLMQC